MWGSKLPLFVGCESVTLDLQHTLSILSVLLALSHGKGMPVANDTALLQEYTMWCPGWGDWADISFVHLPASTNV